MNDIPKFDLDYKEPELNEWSIYHGYRGSVAHGMYIPSEDPLSVDDVDTINICVPPLDYYMGLKEYGTRGTHEIKRGKWDIVSYEVRKFIYLLAEGNPNVLSTLWTNKIISHKPAWALIIGYRHLFVTKSVYNSFAGYASGQLYKMEHMAFEGYMGEKRKSIVAQFGYDVKNASHCIRLLRMAEEFFNQGFLIVDRTSIDADELLDIKRGKWTIEQVKSHAEDLFARVKVARDNARMPDYPDKEAINKLCERVVSKALGVTIY